MMLFILALCFLPNMCFIKCEDREIWIVIPYNEIKECIVLPNYHFYEGDNVTLSVKNKNFNTKSVTRISIQVQGKTNQPGKSLSVPNITTEYNNTWEISVNFKDNDNSDIISVCDTVVTVDKAEPDSRVLNEAEIREPLFVIIGVQFAIMLALICGLAYLICRVKSSEKLLRVEDRTQTPQNDDNKSQLFDGAESNTETLQTARYISKPGLKTQKISPVIDNKRESDIYEVPDITKCDQDTLRSNKSIALRPPLPIPDEEIYSELTEPPPMFVPQSTVRPRPKITGHIQEKQIIPFPAATMKPQQPKITADMFNRFATPHDSKLSPTPPRKEELSPCPPRKMEHRLPSVQTRVQINDLSLPRNKAVHMPQSQYPIPGPSDLKKNLKPVSTIDVESRTISDQALVGHLTLPSVTHGQAQTSKMPQSGPGIPKKPPKPLPPPSKLKAPVKEPVQHFNDFRQENHSDDSDFDEYEPIYSL